MERNFTIDVVKCFAVLIVVCLHTVTYGYDWQESGYISFIVGIFPRWVIPFFFIVSGYFFGRKVVNNKGFRAYVKKYLVKLISLFVTWYIFYLIYDLILRVVLAIYMGSDLTSELIHYVNSFINISDLYYGKGMTSFHLWFLTALIWSVVILYIFIRLRKVGLLLIAGCILNLVGLLGQTYSSVFYLPIQTRDALFFGLLYTTMGSFFAIHYNWIMQKISGIKTSVLIYSFLFFSLFQVIERSITVFILDSGRTFGDYYLSTAPLTICLFLITLKITEVGKGTYIAKVGKNAVGIYVSHLFVISVAVLLLNFIGLDYFRDNVFFNLIFVLSVFITSYYFFIFFNKLLYKIKSLFKLIKNSDNANLENRKTI